MHQQLWSFHRPFPILLQQLVEFVITEFDTFSMLLNSQDNLSEGADTEIT